jgi:hypothetical protein
MKSRFALPEDWSIVATGFLIIALVIFGFPPHLPDVRMEEYR